LFVKKCKKNIFANFSNIFGNVIYKASSGFFHKRSLRKTFFATGFLLKKMQKSIVLKKLFLDDKKKTYKKSFFFLNIVNGNYQRGFKKNLKDFIKKTSSNFFKITELKCKAHNGVRKSKKRRK
jgi:ribosomal protein S11